VNHPEATLEVENHYNLSGYTPTAQIVNGSVKQEAMTSTRQPGMGSGWLPVNSYLVTLLWKDIMSSLLQPVAVAFCLETEGVDLVIVLSSKHSKKERRLGPDNGINE
jgi:hypothetical protein